MEAVTFVCAKCRYRVIFGFPPWEDCLICEQVGRVVIDPPPEQLVLPFPPPPRWRRPYVREIPAREYTWKKPHVWWPMRDVEPDYWAILTQPEWSDEGRGDPYLPYGLFEDIGMSYELRALARAQFELADFILPDIDQWVINIDDVFKVRRHKKTTTKG